MEWTVTMHIPEHTDYDGHVYEEKTTTVKIPFACRQTVYYAYKRRKKWMLRKSEVIAIWATNMVGVELDNGEKIGDSSFDRLFTDKESAIDFCLRQNEKAKVKIIIPGWLR